ncbi:hypothetical protein ACIRQF_31135 [Streptomyces sp. NPDC101191]|uniref:hypothetical protein n=1 Tax=Streptomyces sp. NPDC101191 TaxID=3366126 RepID=UPI0037FB26A9
MASADAETCAAWSGVLTTDADGNRQTGRGAKQVDLPRQVEAEWTLGPGQARVACSAGRCFATRTVIAKAVSRWGHVLLRLVLNVIGLLILIEGGAFGL